MGIARAVVIENVLSASAALIPIIGVAFFIEAPPSVRECCVLPLSWEHCYCASALIGDSGIRRASGLKNISSACGLCRYLARPEALGSSAPVVDALTAGTSVRNEIDLGVMCIITGRSLWSFAVMTRELGTILTSLNPADASLSRRDCGAF
jgi:hypothetical protein